MAERHDRRVSEARALLGALAWMLGVGRETAAVARWRRAGLTDDDAVLMESAAWLLEDARRFHPECWTGAPAVLRARGRAIRAASWDVRAPRARARRPLASSPPLAPGKGSAARARPPQRPQRARRASSWSASQG